MIQKKVPVLSTCNCLATRWQLECDWVVRVFDKRCSQLLSECLMNFQGHNPTTIAGIRKIISDIMAKSLQRWLDLRKGSSQQLKWQDRGALRTSAVGSQQAQPISSLCFVGEDHWKSDLFQPHLQQIFDDTLEAPGFPSGSGGKETACKAGYPSSISGLGRSPAEENGYPLPLRYSCLRIPRTEEPGGLQSMVSQRVQTQQLTLSPEAAKKAILFLR